MGKTFLERAKELHSEFQNAGELFGRDGFSWFKADEYKDYGIHVSLDEEFGIVVSVGNRLFDFHTNLLLSESSKVAPIVKKLKGIFEIYG